MSKPTEKILMFKLRTLYSGRYEIEKVFVDKKTNASVWIRGKRYSRSTERLQYFDTFEHAKQVALEYLRQAASLLQDQLDVNNKAWSEIVFLEEDRVKETTSTY